jgi:hypothetical protein
MGGYRTFDELKLGLIASIFIDTHLEHMLPGRVPARILPAMLYSVRWNFT